MSRPTHLDTFLPNPLRTLDSSLRRSVSLRLRSLASFQFPIGTITDSWRILNSRDLLN